MPMPAVPEAHGPWEVQEREFFSSKGNIIVIHPGSKYLRIGRVSDLKPYAMLQAVARLRSPDAQRHEDTLLVPDVRVTKHLLSEVEDCCIEICSLLQSCIQSNGGHRGLTPYTKIASMNRSSQQQPESIDKSNLSYVRTVDPNQAVVGDKVVYLEPRDAYNIHFPFRRGELNVHPGVGGSLTSVINDVEIIWCYAIEKLLRIPKAELGVYKAVLVIPDIYNRQHLKELTNLLLVRLGFASCFLVQMKMEYGGSDITQAFFWLLRRAAFPVKPCKPSDPVDAMILTQLKEDYCHLNMDISGIRDVSVTVDRPESMCRRYRFKLADECIIAPLGLFFPSLFSLTERHCETKGQPRYQHQAEDPHDMLYIRETGRRGKKEAEAGEDMAEEEEVGGDMDDFASGSDFQSDILLALDAAVLQSIERASETLSEEVVRKLYTNILVVGGSAKIEGFSTWLQNRIALKIPIEHRGEPIEVMTRVKDQDSENTVWKGAALFACMDAANELWIKPKEWKRYSVKILRERAPFVW
ncbi:actin-related protein 8-like isoform X2 [Artemia franciscana]|uniref:actin-related protein 8-like isoform X2 n=1 Tax=Artemia franciscana TaxID=6661 RepID=UPI0032DB55D6